MTCTDKNLYEQKANPLSPKVSPLSAKANPLTEKVSPLSVKQNITSEMCFDYTVKTFENGDFFATQDNNQLIFNLA